MEHLVFADKHLQIYYNPQEAWLYVKWVGLQTTTSVMAGCEKTLEYLKAHKCAKVLNDNALADGIWSGAARWVANNWFPRMRAAGLERFAWIYSPSALSQLSTDKTLSLLEQDYQVNIKTFYGLPTARQWLRAV